MQAKNKRERRKRRRDQEDDAVPRKLPMTAAERMRRYRARRDEDMQSILNPGTSGTEEDDHRTAQQQLPLSCVDIASPPAGPSVELPDGPFVPATSVENQPLLPSVNAG